jgi:hypothetical protein
VSRFRKVTAEGDVRRAAGHNGVRYRLAVTLALVIAFAFGAITPAATFRSHRPQPSTVTAEAALLAKALGVDGGSLVPSFCIHDDTSPGDPKREEHSSGLLGCLICQAYSDLNAGWTPAPDHLIGHTVWQPVSFSWPAAHVATETAAASEWARAPPRIA